MANTKLNADGYAITVWWALPNAFSDWKKPTVAELNATTDVTASVAWENYSFGTQASNQNSDPSFIDVGNPQTRGFANFGGTISFYYPNNYTDTANEYLTTFDALSEPRTLGYVVIRVDGQKTTSSAAVQNKVAVAGDFVRIYKVISDGWADVNTGENAFKYSITFQPQGNLWVNAVVDTSVTVATPAAVGSADYTVGGKTPLGSYITGRQLSANSGLNSGTPGWLVWASDDTAVATVDQNGVVTGVSAGDADITATWEATGTSSTALSITIS